VDASVGIKLFLVEPLSDRADALFAHLVTEPLTHFYVPDLFLAECANVLWKYVRRFGYPAENAMQNVADLTALALIETVAPEIPKILLTAFPSVEVVRRA